MTICKFCRQGRRHLEAIGLLRHKRQELALRLRWYSGRCVWMPGVSWEVETFHSMMAENKTRVHCHSGRQRGQRARRVLSAVAKLKSIRGGTQ